MTWRAFSHQYATYPIEAIQRAWLSLPPWNPNRAVADQITELTTTSTTTEQDPLMDELRSGFREEVRRLHAAALQE